jgi:hypothetical protein
VANDNPLPKMIKKEKMIEEKRLADKTSDDHRIFLQENAWRSFHFQSVKYLFPGFRKVSFDVYTVPVWFHVFKVDHSKQESIKEVYKVQVSTHRYMFGVQRHFTEEEKINYHLTEEEIQQLKNSVNNERELKRLFYQQIHDLTSERNIRACSSTNKAIKEHGVPYLFHFVYDGNRIVRVYGLIGDCAFPVECEEVLAMNGKKFTETPAILRAEQFTHICYSRHNWAFSENDYGVAPPTLKTLDRCYTPTDQQVIIIGDLCYVSNNEEKKYIYQCVIYND